MQKIGIFYSSTTGNTEDASKQMELEFGKDSAQIFNVALDGNEWEYKNRNSYYRRKIIIPIGHKNINILLNNEELQELKQLLSTKKQEYIIKESINIMNLDITIFLN